LAPRLTDLIRNEAAEVTGIEIAVQGRAGKPSNPEKNTPTTIGDRAKRGLTSLESTLPDGSRLRQALARLIERS
jgi:hypothetical protein